MDIVCGLDWEGVDINQGDERSGTSCPHGDGGVWVYNIYKCLLTDWVWERGGEGWGDVPSSQLFIHVYCVTRLSSSHGRCHHVTRVTVSISPGYIRTLQVLVLVGLSDTLEPHSYLDTTVHSQTRCI